MTCLEPSDWIQIIGILASTAASIVAIVVSVKALKQNTKMLASSTRPYIVIYGTQIDCGVLQYGFVLKNFGKTAAVITKFECDCDLQEISHSKTHVLFKHIVGTMLAPEQSILSIVDRFKVFSKYRAITFNIEYISDNQKYAESFVINCDAETDNASYRTTGEGEDIKNISYALQEIVERLL